MNSITDIFAKHPLALATFVDEGIFEEEFYNDLFDYFVFTSQEMPYDIAKGRFGDPDQWIADELHVILAERVVDKELTLA